MYKIALYVNNGDGLSHLYDMRHGGLSYKAACISYDRINMHLGHAMCEDGSFITEIGEVFATIEDLV